MSTNGSSLRNKFLEKFLIPIIVGLIISVVVLKIEYGYFDVRATRQDEIISPKHDTIVYAPIENNNAITNAKKLEKKIERLDTENVGEKIIPINPSSTTIKESTTHRNNESPSPSLQTRIPVIPVNNLPCFILNAPNGDSPKFRLSDNPNGEESTLEENTSLTTLQEGKTIRFQFVHDGKLTKGWIERKYLLEVNCK